VNNSTDRKNKAGSMAVFASLYHKKFFSSWMICNVYELASFWVMIILGLCNGWAIPIILETTNLPFTDDFHLINCLPFTDDFHLINCFWTVSDFSDWNTWEWCSCHYLLSVLVACIAWQWLIKAGQWLIIFKNIKSVNLTYSANIHELITCVTSYYPDVQFCPPVRHEHQNWREKRAIPCLAGRLLLLLL